MFAVGRRENVVIADTLIFPNHQVRTFSCYSQKEDSYHVVVYELVQRLILYRPVLDSISTRSRRRDLREEEYTENEQRRAGRINRFENLSRIVPELCNLPLCLLHAPLVATNS